VCVLTYRPAAVVLQSEVVPLPPILPQYLQTIT